MLKVNYTHPKTFTTKTKQAAATTKTASCRPKQGLGDRYQPLPKERGQRDAFEKFERKITPYAVNILRSYFTGATVSTKGCASSYGYDATMSYQGRSFKVEFKTRQKVWPDLAIEILQDVDRGSAGWLTLCEADYLLYVMCRNDRPQLAYLLPWRSFKAWFLDYREEHELKTITSTKGQARPLCEIVPVEVIPRHLYRVGTPEGWQ